MIPAGVAILVLSGLWLFGGLLARAGGALLMLAGLVGVAAIGNANAFVVFVLGAGLWLSAIGTTHCATVDSRVR